MKPLISTTLFFQGLGAEKELFLGIGIISILFFIVVIALDANPNFALKNDWRKKD